MATIIILLGEHDSGKSKTIKQFMGMSGKKNNATRLFSISGKCVPVFVRKQSSPQECHRKNDPKGIADIKERLTKCKKLAKELGLSDFILLLPFSMLRSKGAFNETAILDGIELLKNENEVFVIHFKNNTTKYFEEVNEFVESRIRAFATIKSNEEYKEQAKELEILIKLTKI